MKKNNEKYYLAVIALLLFSVKFTTVDAKTFDVGDKDLNMTIGVGSPWVLYHHNYTVRLPLVAASFDYGFRDDIGPGVISLGGIVAATTYKNPSAYIGLPDEYGYKSTTLIGAVRSTYHYKLVDKLDTYGGVHLGVRVERWKEYGNIPVLFDPGDINFRPVFNVFCGAKYYFTPQIAAMLELGYSIAFVNAGICIRL
jgi:hypothetical protein